MMMSSFAKPKHVKSEMLDAVKSSQTQDSELILKNSLLTRNTNGSNFDRHKVGKTIKHTLKVQVLDFQLFMKSNLN